MSKKRQAIPKRTRFEVFKRDAFTCQYCGATAPDVVLHCDHIQPVSKGGDNAIVNLITSCASCNGGKSNVELDDDAAIKKQRAQLEEVNERREQLKMMLEWRNAMKGIGDLEVDAVAESWSEIAVGFSINETGRKEVRGLLRKYGLQSVLDAVDIAGQRYIKLDAEGNATRESVEMAFRKISGVCYHRSQPEDQQRLAYIRGIVRNRMYINESLCKELLHEAYGAGASVEDLTKLARNSRNWSDWQHEMRCLITDSGQ